MSGVDVRELASEDLLQAQFPVSSKSKFRLFLAPDVHRGIQQHAKEDVSVEICGVLVGMWKRDDDGPYADASDYIRCESATSKFAEVTFTHESWSQINLAMDAKSDDVRILGWYHSHPDFGIFLSDRDCFIQENFFSGAGQVAYVVDPVRDLEGVFAWENGKPEVLSHYWIGQQICTSHASLRSPTTERNAYRSAGEATGNSLAGGDDLQRPAQAVSVLQSPMVQLLTWVCVFLMGYLLAGWRTSWERQRIVEGVVAHYGVDKVIKLGLQEDLAEVQARMNVVSKELQELSDAQGELTADELQARTNQRMLIAKNLDFLGAALESISRKYSFSDEERRVVFHLVARKHAELQKLSQKKMKPEAEKSAATDESSPSGNAEGTDSARKPVEPSEEPPTVEATTEKAEAEVNQKDPER